MKKYEHKCVLNVGTEIIKELELEGWEICAIVDNPLLSNNKEFWFKREVSDINYSGLLISCAYMRNIPHLQHRTISEFAQFVEDVMSRKPKCEKYCDFDINSTDAIEQWIKRFHDYCEEYYSKWEQEALENEMETLKKMHEESNS